MSYLRIGYKDGRFNVPNFQDVANDILKVIACKEKKLCAEIKRIFRITGLSLSPKEFEIVSGHVADYFNEERYLGRLEGFVQGVKRKAASYGLPFDPQMYRVDLAESLFAVGVKNAVRRGLTSVSTELSLYARSHQSPSVKSDATIDDIIDLKPNFCGLGINLNALNRRFWAKKYKDKHK